jgi:hypothetical protein
MSDTPIALSEAERSQRVLAAFRILAAAAQRKHAQQTGRANPQPSQTNPLTDRLF